LLRIPGSINSKDNTQVKIIQKNYHIDARLKKQEQSSNSITRIINKNFTLSFMIMSELFTNKAMEDDMTKKFLCILYFQDRNERQVIENGLNPNTIWEEMGYKSFEISLIPKIIVKLINNNLQNHYLTFDSITGNVKLTDIGRAYGSQNCY